MAARLDLIHFGDLYNVIPDAVLFVDQNGIVIQANTSACEMFNYDIGVLLGESIEALIPNRFRAAHPINRETFGQDPVKRPMGSGIDIWAKRSDGSKFPADIMLSPINQEGSERVVCCVIRDVTEQYEAQREVAIKKDRFKAVWNNTTDAIAISDVNGTVIDANLAYYDLYGLEPEAVVGESFSIIFPEKSRAYAIEEYHKVFSAPEPPPKYEAVVRRGDGTERIVESKIQFITDEKGRRTAMISTIRDITEQKQAEAKEKRHAHQLESLMDIGQELTTQLDLDSLLRLIVKHAVTLLNGFAGGIYLYRPEQDILEWVVAYGPNLAPPGETLSINQGVSGKVWARGEAMIVDHYSKWDGRAGQYDDFEWYAIIAAPVLWGKELLGVINVLADKPNAFTDDDKNLIEILAAEAATAIYNARLFNSEREQRLLAETLVEVTMALTVHTSFSAILEEVLKQTIRLVACKTANIALIKDGYLYTDHQIYYESKRIEAIDNEIYSLDQLPLLIDLVNSGQPLVITDTSEEPEWVVLPNSEWVRSFMAVPITLHKEVIGVLRLDDEKVNGFSEKDGQRLTPLASAAAVALSKAQMLEQAQQEIFERVQAEEALLQSLRLIEQIKQDWEATADSFDQVIALLNSKGNLIRINRAAQLWGLGSFSDLLEKDLHVILHGNCADPDCYFNVYWEKAWREVAAGRHTDYEVLDKVLDRYLRIQLRPITEMDENKYKKGARASLRSAVAVIVDITEQKRVEEAILHTQKLESLGVLAGGIAHDFNNLLASILSENSLALMRLPEDEPARVHISRANQTVERAADLTRQMLAYTGKGQFKEVALDLNDLIQENLLLLQASIPRKVKLITDLTFGLPPVKGDAGQLQQVVMNLILNAAESYTDGQGQVIVSTITERIGNHKSGDFPPNLERGDYVCLTVEDFGAGMDEETLSRIFDPFYTTKFTGRGLGLSAVSGIIRQHSGEIQVESKVGKGTIFKVFLPITTVEPTQHSPASITHLTKNGCILIIDDEVAIRTAITDFLRFLGQDVYTGEDGLAGLEMFKKHADEIDLVILDMTMPTMSGKETLIELHKIRPNLPVLLLSGFSEEEVLDQIESSDLVDFLQKPFRLPNMLQKLNEMLK